MGQNETSSIRGQIEYGLKQLHDDDRTVAVPLSDLLYIHQTLGEFVRFFHQPKHYTSLDSVRKFLGHGEPDGFEALCRCYYKILGDCWPPDIDLRFDNGEFENPVLPFYYYNQTDPEE